MAKTNAERCRDYRQKRKSKKIKKTAKSSAERVREFRARHKLSINVQNRISNTCNNAFTVQNIEQDHYSGNERHNQYGSLLHKYECKRKLKVYTTRLDDMNIITYDLKVTNMRAFIDTIIDESMPIYNEKSVVTRAAPDVNKLVSYYILKYKIDLYNSIIKLNRNVIKQRQTNQKKNAQSYRNNENTKSNCNEHVKLKSFYNKDPLKSVNVNFLNSMKTDHYNVPKDNVIDVEFATNENSTKLKVTGKYPNKTYMIIEDDYSMETDIYYLNKSNEITQHYKSKGVSNNDLTFYYNGCNTMRLNYCCWYRKFFDTVSNSTIEYISKPHKCIPDRCKCCCRKCATYVSNHMKAQRETLFNPTKDPFVLPKRVESNTLTRPVQKLDIMSPCYDNVTIEKLQKTQCTENSFYDNSNSILRTNEVIINNLITKTFLSSSNVIKKAFNYSPFINRIKNFRPSNISEFLNCVIIEIRNSKTHTHERYKIGPDGDIEDYCIMKLRDLGNYNDHQGYVLNNDGEYEKIAADICCWYTRKNFIDEFRPKLLPTTIKFISSSQEYCETKCISCQILSQSKVKFNNNLIDLSLPEHEYEISDNVNKIFSLEINFTYTTQPKTQMTTFIIEKSLFIAKNINHQMKNKSTPTCTNEIQNVPQSLILFYPNLNQSNTDNIMTVPQSVDSNCSSDSPEGKQLVNSILENTNNVQFIINSEGKILAQFLSINLLNSEGIQTITQNKTDAQSNLDGLGQQIGNSQFSLCNPPAFTSNMSEFLTQNDNVMHSTDPCLHDNTTTINEKDNTVIVNEPFTTVNNTLLHNEFSTLMKTKRRHYLKSFKKFLMIKQENLTPPTVESVSSVAHVNEIKATKRKANCAENRSIKMNKGGSGEFLKASKRKLCSEPEVGGIDYVSAYQNPLIPGVVNSDGSVTFPNVNIDGLNKESVDPLQGTNKKLMYLTEARNKPHTEAHYDKKNMPGPSKIVAIPQPGTASSFPILENLLRAPSSTLHTKNMQVTLAKFRSLYIRNTSYISSFSKTLCSKLTSEIVENVHDSSFKDDSTDDDVILEA